MEQIDDQARIAAPTPDRRTHRKRMVLAAARAAGIGALAGFVGGIGWGLAARLAMRIVALAAYQPTEFSGEGTLLILMIGAFLGVLAGMIFAAVRRLVPGTALRQGIVLGGVALLVVGPLLYQGFREEAANLSVMPLAIGLFGVLLVGLGLAIASIYQPLDRRLLNGSQNPAAAIGSGILLALPFVYALAVIAALSLGGFE